MTGNADCHRRTPGLGSVRGQEGRCVRRIVVSFDDDTFSDIRSRAAKRGVSFAALVRELVEWGLLEGEE